VAVEVNERHQAERKELPSLRVGPVLNRETVENVLPAGVRLRREEKWISHHEDNCSGERAGRSLRFSETSPCLRDLLIAVRYFPDLLGFHPVRYSGVDVQNWLAGFLRDVFGGKSAGEFL